MSAAPGAQVRAMAADVIAAVRFDGRSLKAALTEALPRIADARDRALCEAIAFSAVRFLPRYEFWLGRLLARPLPLSGRRVHALLLAGLAQLEAIGLSDYAAISATAEAARVLRQPRLVGLVNAVLRRFTRERAALEAAAQADPVAADAHPAWLSAQLEQDWPADASVIRQANLQAAPMWLRVNPRRGSREACLERFASVGIPVRSEPLAAQAVCLARPQAPTTLPGWDDGAFSVQDLSAQLAVPLLGARAGERVLDIGAAPGGKSAQILECFPDIAELVALDVDAARLARVAETLRRLGLSAHCVAGDGGAPETWWDGRPFDRILLDAPCSATGVVRRQPDIAWHRRAEDIPVLVAQQARLLDAAWSMLRPGGRLVYATCSVLRAENDRQIDAFLARTETARPLLLPDVLGLRAGAGLQRFPEPEGGDGFFYAALKKAALACLLATMTGGCAEPTARARIESARFMPGLDGGSLELTQRLEFSEAMRQALEHGIALRLVFDIDGCGKPRERALWLRHAPLNRQYEWQAEGQAEVRGFVRLPALLAALDRVRLPMDLPLDAACEGTVAVRLDLAALPTPLRFPAFFEPEQWRLHSAAQAWTAP